MFQTSDLELLIASAHSEGRAHFGELDLDLETYRERIHAIVHKHLGSSPHEETALLFVKALHRRDLYLATACAQQSPGLGRDGEVLKSGGRSCHAWKTLETTYKAFIHDLARLFFRQSFIAQDLADNILADLFLPDKSGSSRIVSYDGRSSLCTWLRVILCNRAINARRSAFSQRTEIEVNIPDKPALTRFDQTMRARRYGPPLVDSVALACRGLTPRERLLLLWRYEDGLQLGQIAQMLGIHQSNVTRRLERMHGKLRDQIIQILSTKYAMSGAAIQECLTDVVENPSHAVSILDFIRTPALESTSKALAAAAPRQVSREIPLKRHGT